MKMFEGMFGPKKKVVEAKDLPPQPRPYFTHDPSDDPYRGGLPMSAEESARRFLKSGTLESQEVLSDVAPDDALPTPSQGGTERVGMRRNVEEENRFDTLRRGKSKSVDNSWKTYRKDQAK